MVTEATKSLYALLCTAIPKLDEMKPRRIVLTLDVGAAPTIDISIIVTQEDVPKRGMLTVSYPVTHYDLVAKEEANNGGQG